MLSMLGLGSASELFRTIPQDVQLGRELKITDPLAEPEVIAAMEEMAARNTAATKPSFLWGRRLLALSPTIVDHLIQRSEFLRPYAVSAGDLAGHTSVYLRVPDADLPTDGNGSGERSMYDRLDGDGRGILMAQRVTRRDKIVVAKSAPEYRDVAVTYAQHGDTEIVEIGYDEATGRVAGLRLSTTRRRLWSCSRRTSSVRSRT